MNVEPMKDGSIKEQKKILAKDKIKPKIEIIINNSDSNSSSTRRKDDEVFIKFIVVCSIDGWYMTLINIGLMSIELKAAATIYCTTAQ